MTPDRLDAYGFGPKNINLYGDCMLVFSIIFSCFFPFFQFLFSAFNITLLIIKSIVANQQICTEKIKKISNITDGIMENQICAGQPLFLVPNSCGVSI
jgi:hypothetical protein